MEHVPSYSTITTASITSPISNMEPCNRHPTTAVVHHRIPDIVIDDVYGDALSKEAFTRLGQLPTSTIGANVTSATTHANSHPLYQVDDDNIMWL